MQRTPEYSDELLRSAWSVIDEAWREMQLSPFVQSHTGTPLTQLPDVSFANAERRSKAGSSILERLDALGSCALPHELALTLRLARFRAETWSREAEWYWMVIDPEGIGCFGLFLPTAYCGGKLLNALKAQLASFDFAEAADVDRYLALVAGYGRLVDQFTERTAGQAQRGIRMPKVQVHQARALLTAFKAGARAALGVAPERLVAVGHGRFARDLESRMSACVEPAFDRALAGLSNDYLAQAPEAVGMGQFPGGEEIYAELVRLHTTLDLTPEQVHARGLERMAEIEASIDAIQSELGFAGDSAGFGARLSSDPRWRADTAERVTAIFQRYMDRLTPHLSGNFPLLPHASYGVAPLPETLQRSMTFGYYDPPRKDRDRGLYMFNPANMTKRPLFNIGALTYHELMPGHHLQLAVQHENPRDLHPLRAHSFVNAYVEGWAEYAATFAGEIGMYELPEERYGRLEMDAFLTSRLVVDTGMNVMGWSLERGRDYLRSRGRLPEAEVLTESARYSCDIPGQALAYKLGDKEILAMRERMRSAMGSRFDIKDFHRSILGPGALPLRDLGWHVNHEIDLLGRAG